MLRFNLCHPMKILSILSLLTICSSFSIAASSMSTSWKSDAQTSEISNANNWTNGAPVRNASSGPDITFNNVGMLNLSGILPDTSDGGGIHVSGNSTVSLSGNRWGGNIDVEKGSSLTLNGQCDYKDSIINLDGLLIKNDVAGVQGGHPITINFGTEGKMIVNAAFWGASGSTINGKLSLISPTAVAGAYDFVVRTLFSCTSFAEGSFFTLGTFTDGDGNTLTKSANDLIGSAEDNKNNYYVYRDGNDVKVKYVGIGKSIPEPTTITLSLVGLGILLLRRRISTK